MARQLVRLVLVSVFAMAMVAGSVRAFWVNCTSTHQSMSNIAYNTAYDITTEAGRDTGDPSYYSINYSQVALYSLITGASGDGNWHLKGTCNTTRRSSLASTIKNWTHHSLTIFACLVPGLSAI